MAAEAPMTQTLLMGSCLDCLQTRQAKIAANLGALGKEETWAMECSLLPYLAASASCGDWLVLSLVGASVSWVIRI